MAMISKETAEHYTWGDICDGWHLLKSSSLSVIQERVPAGGAEVKHYHEHAHQFFFISAGEATLELVDDRFVLHSGQGLSVPPKTPHRLLNEGKEDLSFLVISAPQSHGDRVVVL